MHQQVPEAAINQIQMKTVIQKKHRSQLINNNQVHHWHHCAKSHHWLCRNKFQMLSIHGHCIKRISVAVVVWAVVARQHQQLHAILHQLNVNSSQIHRNPIQVSINQPLTHFVFIYANYIFFSLQMDVYCGTFCNSSWTIRLNVTAISLLGNAVKLASLKSLIQLVWPNYGESKRIICQWTTTKCPGLCVIIIV